MSIQILFFASLKDKLGISEIAIDAQDINTATDVWNIATKQQVIPTNTLVAINKEYADLGQAVLDGDEVAFFPPVTGG